MSKPICQYCGTDKNTVNYIPGGGFCKPCMKNLRLIRTLKLGIPKVKRGKIMDNENFDM